MRQLLEGFQGRVAVRKEGTAFRISGVDLPEPVAIMEADAAWVSRRSAAFVEFSYGRLDAAKQRFQERLTVRVALDAFSGGVAPSLASLKNSVDRWLADKPALRLEIEEPASYEVVEDLTERASIIKVSFLGAVAAVDHVDIDLHEMARIVRETPDRQEAPAPVRNGIRVHLPTPEVLRMIEGARELAPQVASDLNVKEG